MMPQESESQNQLHISSDGEMVKHDTWQGVVKKFRNLPKDSQEAVNTFFNLHNAAIWIYNNLTDDARVYVDQCIEMSQENNSAEHVEQE